MDPTRDQNTKSQNRKAAVLSLGLNAGLTILKFIAAGLTGSVSPLSEAFHSGTDVVASLAAYLSIRAAAVPPDDEHPYGHGKIESLAAFGEGILLLGVVLFILIQSVVNLLRGKHPERLGLGMAAMSISAICAMGLGIYLLSVAKRTDSVALKSNGRHMLLDFWTSIGVLGAFLIQHFLGFKHADSVLGILIGLWLGFGAWRTAKEAFEQLIDRRVTDEDLQTIQIVLSSTPDLISFHRLRTRHSGNVHYVDLHAVVPREWSVVQAHELADHIEKQISTALAPAHVVVHIDPFDESKVTKEQDFHLAKKNHGPRQAHGPSKAAFRRVVR